MSLTGIVAGDQGITASFQAHADAALAPLTCLDNQQPRAGRYVIPNRAPCHSI